MRIIDRHIVELEGWLTMSTCNGCDDTTTQFVLAENPAGYVIALCYTCIRELAEAALKQDDEARSRA